MAQVQDTVTTRGLELRGAYGRETSLADWKAGKDFKIEGGPYCSIRDVEAIRAEGFDLIEFRSRTGSYIHTIVLNPVLRDRITGPGTRVLNEG